MKRCNKCGEFKPLDQFTAHPSCTGGRLHKCRKCHAVDCRSSYIKNREARLAACKEYVKRPEVAERRRAYGKTYNATNSRKKWCRQVTYRAVQSGKIKRGACVVCGSENSEAHHESYDNPMAITWLCPTHHKQLHQNHYSLI